MSQSREVAGQASGQAVHIEWRAWSAGAFEQAQEENKPVLLSIGAVWCYWCQVMDETTYADPEIIDYVSRHFIAVRVDNDHRPDINLRYNVGGWPSTVFLTGHGGNIAGATYLPPDQLLAMLMEVQRAYQDQKPEMYDQGNSVLRQRRDEVRKIAFGPELGPELVDRLARRAVGTYDARNGGFGEAPKFPGVPILGFLLHLYRTTGEDFYRVMLQKTLNGMAESSLWDQHEGGFFRYSATPDWSEPQHEKMLEDNIGLARVYLDAFLLLGEERYRRTASDTIDYLMNHLYDPQIKGFRGSQGAHSDYFGLSPEGRKGQIAPAPDPFCYAGWSAQAVSLLLQASWRLPRIGLKETALEVLDALDSMARNGSLPHAYSAAGPAPGLGGQQLSDWAHLLNALLDAASLGGDREKYLARAKDVAAQMIDWFNDHQRGGFFDLEQDSQAVGYLQVREKPLPDNVAAVQGLLKLHQAAGDQAILETARQTLSAYVEANRDYGEFAASYAVTVDLLLNRPLEITVEGPRGDPATHAMLAAAYQASYPHVVVKLVEADAPVQAHVCVDTLCLPPVSDPADLPATVAEAVAPQESPFEDMFQQFGGL